MKEPLLLFRVTARAVIDLHTGYSLRAFRNRVVLSINAARYWHHLRIFFNRLSVILSSKQLQAVAVEYVGLVQWPYVNNQWGVPERLDAVAAHYEVIPSQYVQHLHLGREERVCVADLSGFAEGCSIILDRPKWFMREGELVLNIFERDLRVASIAFLLGRNNGKLILYIGAVQGIHKGVPSDRSLEIYRKLTKQFEGLRPRSLLLEILIIVSDILGVDMIAAVCDKNRHHRHPYFGARNGKDLGANYDEIWLEHGAFLSYVDGFYEIPVLSRRKNIEDIPSRKRAMYRRRYELLESITKDVKNYFINGSKI